jgi:hypothetical protein
MLDDRLIRLVGAKKAIEIQRLKELEEQTRLTVASQQLAALIQTNGNSNLSLEELVVCAVRATDLLLYELTRGQTKVQDNLSDAIKPR